MSRLNQHETDHLWARWDYFRWFGFRRVNKSGELSAFDDVEKVFRAKGSLLLNEVEGALLTALEPKLNKQGPHWKDVTEYYQTRDDEMEEATVGDLMEKLDAFEKRLRKEILPLRERP